uniref:RNA polymerase beta' subunit n=1 Tax=Coelastrum microporum TaxID=55409 RepID=UPI00226D18A1|nr:RNA polymerase beta' subunit [Coelastrum microporum]UWM13093.1 RNA polymerase beta' subunit [Coelastrum microporum]
MKNNEFQKSLENSFQKNENSKKMFHPTIENLTTKKKFSNKKNFFKKKLLKGYSKIHELKLVSIGLASPDKIKSWAEKELPNGKIFGEVTNANTFHYRTFKPSKGGLFCERIFGPIKDFECACGKRQRPTALESRKILEHEQTTRYFCPNCDVEYTWSIIRRYQLGYIKLNAPVAHLWYFKTNPSYLSILFDIKRKHLESIIYCTETITIENMWKTAEQNSKFSPSPTELYKNWQKFFSLEETIQKYYLQNEKNKKTKKQKKATFRENCFQKGYLFQKINWSNLNGDLLEKKKRKNDLFLDSRSKQYFHSFSEKKTKILLNIQKQKQKQLFSRLYQKFWKMILQKTYRKVLGQTHCEQMFLENSNNLSGFFFLNFWSCFSKKFPRFLQKNSLKSTSIPLLFSKNSFFCKRQNKWKMKNAQMIFFHQDFSSKYLEVFSKKNTKYGNFQNFAVFLKCDHSKKSRDQSPEVQPEQFIKATSDFSKFPNGDVQKHFLAHKKMETFWNSFYFLFESGISFVSLKTKKTSFQTFTKKELLFLINLIPLFQKMFFYKKTRFLSKNVSKMQEFLCNTIFLSKKKNKRKKRNLNFFANSVSLVENKMSTIPNENFSSAQKQSFKNSQLFFFSKAKQHLFEDFQNFFPEDSSIPSEFLKNHVVWNSFPKNTKTLKCQISDQMQKFIFPDHFFETINQFEKILAYFQQYYEIEFCLSFCSFHPAVSSFLSQEKNDSSQDFLFSALSSLSEQLNLFEKDSCSPLSNFEFETFALFANISENTLNQENQFHEIFKEFGAQFFENSHVYSFFEKRISEYFSLCLFLLNSLFYRPRPNAEHRKIAKKRDSTILFVPKLENPQRQNRLENKRQNAWSLSSLLFFNLLKISPQQKKENETSFHPLIFKFQQCSYFSFFFFSLPLFKNIVENQSVLKKRNQKNVQQNLFQNANKPFKTSQDFAILKLEKVKKGDIDTPFLRKTRKIFISNNLFGFPLVLDKKQNILTNRKKFYQKTLKLQKQNFFPWLSEETGFHFQLLDSRKKASFVKSIETSSGGKKTLLVNQTQSMKSLQASEKPRLNFSLFFQKTQKSKILENQSFFKNPVSTIGYNAVWTNDSDWKYFVYYNAFFMNEFQDKPIFEYRTVSKYQHSPFFSTENSFFETLDDSFASFLSLQIDSFQKNFFIGAGILEKFLTEYTSLELRKMTKQHQILLPKINQKIRVFKQMEKTKKDSLKIQKYFQKREHIIRRLKFLRKFYRRNSNPSFMILRNIPVLPPDLRPILKLQNQIAASDLNRFYQRIIYRNDRLKKFSKDSATNQSFEMKYAQRLLQEAVDNLIQNGKGSVKAETNSRGQALKSLSEILKGKQGRFRQYLLGKRVDYSGRSVIVVGPQLKLYECGLPKEMAFELFLPFLIQYILHSKLAQTVIGAKNLLKSNSTLTFHLLNKVMKNIPVLLNRAPTLHRLGFQAFLPKLIEGRAILLHPMVCPAFNADFDGDQMAVHIPLTVEARTEAWKFMLATNNLMNSATGEPILLPSQDMVLGCYFLTLDYYAKSVAVQLSNTFKQNHCSLPKPIQQVSQTLFQKTRQNFPIQNFQSFIREQKSFLLYNNFHEILAAYQRKEISLHTAVWVKWKNPVNFGNDSSKPVEIRLQKNGCWQLVQPKYTTFFDQKNRQFSQFIRTTTGRILLNFMIQDCIELEL